MSSKVNECWLFYNVVPDKSYIFKDESCRGMNVNKERITVLVFANMDGPGKLPALVRGKSTHQCCFKNAKSAMYLPLQKGCI
jgi:hypothetical protein